jgi:hypothetical protein
MSNLETYGLSSQDLLNTQWKIAKQKKYLESQTFLATDGQEKCLLDVSYSANLSERYYPRILNKVDTFVSTSISKGLTPIFLTVTADGFFRRMLKGDYSEWTEELKEHYEKHISNNKRSGFYFDYMEKNHKLTPKDVYKIIGHQLHRFYKCETLRDIKKDGYTYTSIRVTEPHKDGVPHFHILMYVPEQYIPRLYKEFMRFFPAPQNHKKLTFKNTKGKHRRNGHYICDMVKNVNGVRTTVKMYETHGFQTQIRSAAGYILKYILKSFKNLIDGKEIDYLQAWYVHNKIPRLITTHTLVSQEIYHKASMMDNDWHYLTDIKLNDGLTSDRINNYFKFDDGIGRTITGDNGLFILENNGKLISIYGTKQHHVKKYRLRSLSFSSIEPKDFNIMAIYEIWIPPKDYSFYISKSFDDGTFFVYGGNDDFFLECSDIEHIEYEVKKPISRLSDVELFDQYHDFDFDICFPARYAVIHNEMIDRGLLSEDYTRANDYNVSFNDDVQYEVQSNTVVTKLRDMKNEELITTFKNANFFDDESYYARLSYEMNKRDLL